MHERFGDALRSSCAVGGTHVAELGGGSGLPGPRPQLFFAPAQVEKRHADWGPGVLQDRLLQGWRAFVATVAEPAQPWLVPEAVHGAAATQAAYLALLGGAVEPRTGLLVDLR